MQNPPTPPTAKGSASKKTLQVDVEGRTDGARIRRPLPTARGSASEKKCFSPATTSLDPSSAGQKPADPSCAGRKPAARGHEQAGSWQCKRAGKVKVWAIQKATFGSVGCGPRARSVLHCHRVLALRGGPVTRAVQDASQLQEDAGKLRGRQANGRFEASF